MKKIQVFFFAWLFCLLTLPFISAAWEITDYHMEVVLHNDGTARVAETLKVDFQNEVRHGIFRDIPIKYQDQAGRPFTMRIRVLSVTNGQGQPWNFTRQAQDSYLRIRVGDPDKTLSGKQTYQIIYSVEEGAVRFFPDHDELYWNLIGPEWGVDIRKASAGLVLPEGITEPKILAWRGPYGSREPMNDFRFEGRSIYFEPNTGFSPYEGMTAAIAWPKGIILPPSSKQRAEWLYEESWPYLIPLGIFAGMLGLWFMCGRDPAVRRSVVVQYDTPTGMTPAELGALFDDKVDLRDITATIVDLAVKGYLKIELIEEPELFFLKRTDYGFTSLKPWDPSDLKQHEKMILQGIFKNPLSTKKLSDLNEVFYTHLPGIRKSIYRALVEQKLISGDPETITALYGVIALVIGALVLILIFNFQKFQTITVPTIIWPSVFSALIIFVFGRMMPRRTPAGVKQLEHVRGFQEFVRRVDGDKIKQMNDSSLFERCLPFAMAMGLTHTWTRAFQGIYSVPPRWYSGPAWVSFSPSDFGRKLDHAAVSMGKTFSSVPRSSDSSGFGGGGSSGGGGGGGGGGAW